MKTRNILLLMCAGVAAITFLAIAADEPQPTRTPATTRTPAQVQRPMPGRGPTAVPGERGRGATAEPNLPANREDALRDAMARRMDVHRQEIAKLEAIVKIAEGENAAKTVEALKALIAERDKEVKDQIDMAERRREEMQQRLQERLGERAEPRPARPTPAGAGQARPEDAPRGPRPVQRGSQPGQAN